MINFNLLPKHQNPSDYIQFLIQKYFNLLKKGITSSEEIRNAGNYFYDYAHSFISKGF